MSGLEFAIQSFSPSVSPRLPPGLEYCCKNEIRLQLATCERIYFKSAGNTESPEK